MIKGAVFDVDGTLLDSMEIWQDVGARYLKGIGKEPEEHLSEVLAVMTVEEGAQYIKKHYSLPQSAAQIVQGVLEIVQDFYFFEAPLKKGADRFLKALSVKGIPMAVATSGERRLVEAAFRRLGMEHYFQEIFICSEIGAGKRLPLIYQMAAESLGSRAEETFVFEDVLHALQTAQAAGFRTVGVYDRFSEKDREQMEAQADLYLRDFTDFPGFWKFASAGSQVF